MTATAEQLKVLYVDDDKYLADIYSRKLIEHGCVVTSVLSGEQAIAEMHSGFVPDIVIADLLMPGMSGADLRAAMVSEGLAPDAVFVLLSNQEQETSFPTGVDVPIDGYIVKATRTPAEVINDVVAVHQAKHAMLMDEPTT